MKKAAFLIVFILACNGIVAQEFNYFIKYDDIPGELTDNRHKDWCDLESFVQNVHSNDISVAGTSTDKGKTISIVKKIDKSSPKIMEALIKRKVIKLVELEVLHRTGDFNRVVYKYDLKDVAVMEYNVLGKELEWPMEEITLIFKEQKVRYTWYKRDGELGGHIDMVYE